MGIYSRMNSVKMDSRLLPLIEENLLPQGQSIEEYRQTMQYLGQFLPAGSLLPRENIRTPADVVYVQISFGEEFTVDTVEPLAWRVTDRSEKHRLLIAWVQVDNLKALAAQEAVRIIRPVMPPQKR